MREVVSWLLLYGSWRDGKIWNNAGLNDNGISGYYINIQRGVFQFDLQLVNPDHVAGVINSDRYDVS